MRQTSLIAYKYLQESIGEKQFKVYSAIKKLGGATNSQISDFLGWPINCVTGRVKELCDQGVVFELGTIKNEKTGRKNTIWGVFL